MLTSQSERDGLFQFSMSGLWKSSFICLCAIVVLQSVIGAWFYKAPVGPIYMTELFIILSWIMVILAVISSGKFPNPVALVYLLLIAIFYLAYSIYAGHVYSWIFRQAAYILYASVGIISFSFFNHRKFRQRANRAKHTFYHFMGGGGGALLVFHKVWDVIPGHPGFTAYLVFLIGFSYWVYLGRSVLQKILIGVMGSLFVYLVKSHTVFVVTPFFIASIGIYFQFPKLRLIEIVVLMLGIIGAIKYLPGVTDHNATWRFVYWVDVVKASWDRGFLLLGKGFGIQYMEEGGIGFTRLIEQVTTAKNKEYQLMTVPPHNGLLTTLIYIGLPGVLLLLWPVLLGVRLCIKNMLSAHTQILLSIILAYLLLLSTNQFLEVPYAAVIFWLFYGALYAGIQQDRYRPVSNAVGFGA